MQISYSEGPLFEPPVIDAQFHLDGGRPVGFG